MQAVITLPPPMRLEYSPSSIRDNLSDTNALMSKRRRKLVRISVGGGDENDHGSLRRLRYLTGSGCGFVIGGAVLGDFPEAVPLSVHSWATPVRPEVQRYIFGWVVRSVPRLTSLGGWPGESFWPLSFRPLRIESRDPQLCR